MSTCLPTGERCSAHRHCCSTFCNIRGRQYVCADSGEISEAEFVDSSGEDLRAPMLAGDAEEASTITATDKGPRLHEKTSYYDDNLDDNYYDWLDDYWFDDFYYGGWFDDKVSASTAAAKESFVKSVENTEDASTITATVKGPRLHGKASYYDDNLDDNYYDWLDDYWFDDFYYGGWFDDKVSASTAAAKEGFVKDRESVENNEDASTSTTCQARGHNCFTSDPGFCCSGICNLYLNYRFLGQCAQINVASI